MYGVCARVEPDESKAKTRARRDFVLLRIIFCPQDAVFRVKKDQSTTGRYVDTDYSKCIGCHICADVCPTGYIDMGMGE